MRSSAVHTRPFALLLVLLAGCATPEEEPPPPAATWYEDVEPIVQNRCMSCHFEGGIGPFALDTYESAAPLAGAIAASVADRRMPPWLPSDDCQPFKDSRALSDAEIATFDAWARAGAPAGEPTGDQALVPERPELPWIDLDKAPEEAYTPRADVTDDYRCFIIDPQVAATQYIIGYDIRPGIPWVVHHVNVVLGDAEQAARLDAKSPGPGWDCMDTIGLAPIAMVGAWAPGTLPIQFPADTGIPLDPGKVFVTQVHYNTQNGDLQPDQTAIRLQYAHEPVALPAAIALLSDGDFEIPPNSTGYTSTEVYEIPFDATLWGIGGHMHEAGSALWLQLERGDETTCLLEIPRWSYDWQQGYFYDMPEGFQAKAGDKVHVTCRWDNPTDLTITWGGGVADEMCIGYFYITGIDVNTQWPGNTVDTDWP